MQGGKISATYNQLHPHIEKAANRKDYFVHATCPLLRCHFILATYGMICSRSRKGDCWDNAVAESFFHSLKTEWTSGMLYRSRNDARSDVIHYIEMFYNSHRLHSYLEYKNPNEVEKNYTVAKAA